MLPEDADVKINSVDPDQSDLDLKVFSAILFVPILKIFKSTVELQWLEH